MTRNPRTPRRLATALVTIVSLLMGMLTLGVLSGRWQAAPVLTGSMQPAISAGSLILAEQRPTSELAVGDVIVFHAPTPARPVIVHRIVGIAARDDGVSLTTMGDANEEPDPWGLEVTAERTWTVTRSIDGVGRLVLAVRSPTAQLLALVMLAVASAFMIDRARPRRGRGAAATRSPDAAGTGAAASASGTSSDRSVEGRDRPLRGTGTTIVVAVVTAVAMAMALPAAQATFTDVEADDLSVSTGVLAAPTDLVATPGLVLGACQVDLAWTPSTSPAATGYEILRRPLDPGLLGGEPAPAGDYEVVLVVEGRETAAATDTLPSELVQLNSQFRYVARSVCDGWRSAHSTSADVNVVGVCM